MNAQEKEERKKRFESSKRFLVHRISERIKESTSSSQNEEEDEASSSPSEDSKL